MNEEATSTPRPDPTERTREELLREIEHLRELVEAKIDGHAEFSSRRYKDLQDLVEMRSAATVRLFDLHLGEARQQLQDQIDATQRATEAALTSTTKAIDKAEEAIEKRFESVNAFREQLNSQAQTFLRVDMFNQHVRESQETKQGLQTRIEANTRELVALAAQKVGGEDKEAQARANIAAMVALVSVLVAVGTLILSLVTSL